MLCILKILKNKDAFKISVLLRCRNGNVLCFAKVVIKCLMV